MPGRSSTAKEEPAQASSPLPFLGAVGGTEGGTGEDDHVDSPVMGPLQVSPAPAPVAEGVPP